MIKKVSNEELVEKFMLHVAQSVVGTSFPPSVIKATQNEIETLRTQLAKANERVKELKADILNAIGAIEREDDESLYDANCILSSSISQLRKEQSHD